MKKSLIIIPTLLLLLTNQSSKVIAQENPGCFMTNSSGRTINLDHICTPDTPKERAIIKGVELTKVSLLDVESSDPIVSGTLKNLTEQSILVNSVLFQVEDSKTGDVVTSFTTNLSVILKPGQSGEFRKPVSSDMDLGGRSAGRLKIVFLMWD